MTDSGSSPEEEFARLVVRAVSAAQGALELVLAPGGLLEAVSGSVAGLIDEVAAPRPEVREHLGEAATALLRAWQALVSPTAPPSEDQGHDGVGPPAPLAP